MGSERLTGALLDRLTHRVHIIEANGESYRLQDARKRRKRPKGGRRPAKANRTPGPSRNRNRRFHAAFRW